MELKSNELQTIHEVLSRYIDEDDYLRHEGKDDAEEKALYNNATAICQRLHQKMTDKYSSVTIPTNAFFNLLAESSWDRPAAWRYFCKLQSIPDDRHLAMRSWDKTWEADLKYLEGIFGKGKIPSELTDGEWDT